VYTLNPTLPPTDVLFTDVYQAPGGGILQASSPPESTYWANSPILYDVFLGTYYQQLPTELWATEALAKGNIGKFERLTDINNPTRFFSLIGYITYQMNSTDLSAASFNKGEFFNYGYDFFYNCFVFY
jgi:hypothetical protein